MKQLLTRPLWILVCVAVIAALAPSAKAAAQD